MQGNRESRPQWEDPAARLAYMRETYLNCGLGLAAAAVARMRWVGK